MADLTDADIFTENLDSTLFPGISSSIKAHSGFANEQAKCVFGYSKTAKYSKSDTARRTAPNVLAAVNTAISKFGAKQVTLVGHSLGAAISLLDSVYLPLHVKGVTFKTVLYGLPRVRAAKSFMLAYDGIISSPRHIGR